MIVMDDVKQDVHFCSSSGSGFIFGEDGLILTNYHVVQAAISSRGSGDASVLVSLQDGRVFDAEVINFDR